MTIIEKVTRLMGLVESPPEEMVEHAEVAHDIAFFYLPDAVGGWLGVHDWGDALNQAWLDSFFELRSQSVVMLSPREFLAWVVTAGEHREFFDDMAKDIHAGGNLTNDFLIKKRINKPAIERVLKRAGFVNTT